MSAPANRGIRVGAWLVLGLGAAMAAPAACFFPSFTFNEAEPSGSGGTGGSPSTSTSTGGTTASSSSSSSSSGHGGGGAAASSSSSSGGVPEDCTNGVDDNGDGKIDCADPLCTPIYGCISAAPAGWTGPFALYTGAAGMDPGCPALYPSDVTASFTGNSGLNAGQAMCSGCTCGAAANMNCDLPTQILVSDATCGNNPNCGFALAEPVGWNGNCDGMTYVGGNTCGPGADATCQSANPPGPCSVSVTTAAPTVSGGSCPPSQVVADVPSLTWNAYGRACGDAKTGMGCNNGQVCAPKTEAPFDSGLCIAKSGNNNCVGTGQFTQKHVYFGDVMDTRGCTACGCSAPQNGQCAATISLYSDLQIGICNTLVKTFNAGTCTNLSGNPNVAGRKATITMPPTGGTCSTTGGQAMGTATPLNPMTYCCVP